MRVFLYSLLVLLTVACAPDQEEAGSFYDPTVPYPLMNKGDFWLNKFDERGLQNARVYDDHLYCNTIDVRGDNYLYCFDLLTGKVIWRSEVSAYATQPIVEMDDKVLYSSYLGQIHCFEKSGTELWNERYEHPYGGHWLDPSDSSVKLITPSSSEVTSYNMDGKLLWRQDNESLKQIIEKNGGLVDHVTKQYQVSYDNWKYEISVKTPKHRENQTIEITRYK